MKKKPVSLIIGMGEIGTAMYKVINRSKIVYARDIADTDHDADDVDILHIAFPYSAGFVNELNSYIEFYDPTLVIVYSTVPVGTCESLGTNIVHSPVEGKHPDLEESIATSPRWLGCADLLALEAAVQFWIPLVKVVRTLDSSRFTEFLKLRSTSKYGINLAWTDYEKSVSDQLGMNFNALQDFDRDYNQLYYDMGLPEFQRYILDPPGGHIGGHCVVPNAEILNEQYPFAMLDEVIKMKGETNGN